MIKGRYNKTTEMNNVYEKHKTDKLTHHTIYYYTHQTWPGAIDPKQRRFQATLASGRAMFRCQMCSPWEKKKNYS